MLKNPKTDKQYGVGLVDCLLALVLSGALLWQVMVLYKDMHQTHAIQKDLSQLLSQGQWFQDYFSYRIKTAGTVACLPKSAQAKAKRAAVMAYDASAIPSLWSIKAAKGTQVLVLGSCQLPTQANPSSTYASTAFFLKSMKSNTQRYTLYRKEQGHPAVALQDNIGQLSWYFASLTKTPGQLTAPQALDAIQQWQTVKAIAWKVQFVGQTAIKHQANRAPLMRTFYGYISRREPL